MRMFKLIVSLLILGVIALFFYQNWNESFTSFVSFKLNLGFTHYDWKFELYIALLVAAAVGFFLGVVLMFKPYRKSRKLLAKERQDRKLTGPTITRDPAPVEKAAEETTAESSAG